MIYGMIGAFGLTVISNALLAGQFWLKGIGGIFLVYLGIKTFLSKAKIQKEHKVHHVTYYADFITTFFLTLANPITILSFIAIFAGIGLTSSDGNIFKTFLLVIGIFLGSALWWLV